jgi:uncharacterized membrane protein HdeD (DUF308 family)
LASLGVREQPTKLPDEGSSAGSFAAVASGGLLLVVAALTVAAIVWRSAGLVGALALVAGAVQFVHGARRQQQIEAIHVASGLLYVIVGVVVVTQTAENRLALALLATLFLAAQGIIRLMLPGEGSSKLTFVHAVVALVLAVVTALWALQQSVLGVVLEVLTWREWPPPDLRGVGLFIVIDMVFCAASLIASRRAVGPFPG